MAIIVEIQRIQWDRFSGLGIPCWLTPVCLLSLELAWIGVGLDTYHLHLFCIWEIQAEGLTYSRSEITKYTHTISNKYKSSKIIKIPLGKIYASPCNLCEVVGIDHVFASGAVVGRATMHEWGRSAHSAELGDPTSWPHEFPFYHDII